MGVFRQYLYHPRRVWLRRALFQVHLWLGILLAVYVFVIALSGAVLVWEDELTGAALPPGLRQYDPGHVAAAETVLRSFQREFPGGSVEEIVWPSRTIPAFRLRGTRAKGVELLAVADPVTGRVTAQPRTWVMWTHDLHVNLLLGSAHGEQWNGVGAAGLLLVAATGLVLWWPGLRVWGRGLRVSWRSHWRRINFDLHSAVGFWTLLIVSWWGISGVYFAWYQPVTAAVNAVSPLHGMVSPRPAPASPGPQASLPEILRAAQGASAGRLYSVSDPMLRGQDVYVLLDRKAAGDFAHRDIVRVRVAGAQVASVWHYGQRESLGDWVLWSMHPLHFGTIWGWPGKVVWCVLGLSLDLLTMTGVLMYWNRYLRHWWRGLRE